MIRSGDRIAVGVSGGKDSMALLVLLKSLQSFYPKDYHIEAIVLDLGFENTDIQPVIDLCRSLDVKCTIEQTVIGKIVFEIRNETNPCSMCANLRRGALNSTAKKLDCNVVALGHTATDALETFLISLFYEGRIHTFSPVTWLERQQIRLIRPLIYTDEKDIKGFIRQNNIILAKNRCPADLVSKRHYIRELLSKLTYENRHIPGNILGAIKRMEIDDWRNI